MPKKQIIVSGIILRSQPLREADLIVSVLTPSLGKLSAIARSARRSKKRFLGGLNVFDCGTFELSAPRGRSELYVLEAMRERRSWLGLRENLASFSLAVYAVELTHIFAAEGDHEAGGLFEPLLHCLEALNQRMETSLRLRHAVRFNLQLLSFSGVSPLERYSRLSPAIRTFWSSLLNGASAAGSLELCQESLLNLLAYSEHISGHRLATHDTLLRLLTSKLVAPREEILSPHCPQIE